MQRQYRMHCDHTVHFREDLSLWLDSPMFCSAPWHQYLLPAVYSS